MLAILATSSVCVFAQGNTLTIYGNEDYVTSTSEIIKLTDTYLMLSTLGIPTSYKRVPDSEIEKYLE